VEPQDELEREEEVGFAIPGTMALLGSAFVLCALAIAGLPPMPVFIGKFALLDAVLRTGDVTIGSGALLALLMVSGFAALVGLGRSGVRRFWASDESIPRIRVVEIAPVILLLGLCAALTLNAGAAVRYLDGAALTQKESVLLPGVNEDLLWSIVPAGTGRLAFIAASSAAVSRVCIVDIPFK
jgi:multicomponent K+:H+ antiporter subunit D